MGSCLRSNLLTALSILLIAHGTSKLNSDQTTSLLLAELKEKKTEARQAQEKEVNRLEVKIGEAEKEIKALTEVKKSLLNQLGECRK
jgi:hypothetical protein